MDALWREIRYTFRRLAKSPTTSFAAVITMALGIGVATGAYSIIDGLTLRGVSFEDADRLVALRRTHLSGPRRSVSVPEHDFVDWCTQQQSFEALIGFRRGTVNLRDTASREPGVPERYNGAWVSPGFLDLLRVDPLLGRGFEPADAAAGAPPVMLLGYHVWQQDYGGAADVVGRTVRVNARPATVVGVLPQDFRFPVSQDVWLPLDQHPRSSALVIAKTRTDPTAFTPALRQTVLEVDPDLPLFFVRSMDQVLGATLSYHQMIGLTILVFGTMALLLAAVGLYGVTFVSVMQRIPEMGVRMALGARPKDVVHLILKQGLAKTSMGLGVGLALGWGLGKALESFLFQVRPEDPVTFLAVPTFLFAVSFLAYLVPAQRASRVDPVEALHSE